MWLMPVPDRPTFHRGYDNVPLRLLGSAEHGDLAVLLWTHYAAEAGADLERWVDIPLRSLADAYGIGATAIDNARHQLLAADNDGPWLERLERRGNGQTTLHRALQRPEQTGHRHIGSLRWMRDRVQAKPAARRDGQIGVGAWRLWVALLETTQAMEEEMTVWQIAGLLGLAHSTARARLTELETAGLLQITERPGRSLLVRLTVDEEEAAEEATRYAQHGRRC